MIVLLLNPPGKKIYIRDLFCSKISKVNFINQPVDLLIQSGILAKEFKTFVYDAIVNKANSQTCARYILELKPDVVIWLTGVISWKEDFEFLKDLKTKHSFLSISLGDYFLENYEEKLKINTFIDAIAFDYTTTDIMNYIKNSEDIKNIAYRKNGSIVLTKIERQYFKEYLIPIPRHDLFINRNYRFPFMRSNSFTTVQTDFGCPYKCVFCIMGTLGYKFRPVENILEEMEYIRKLNIKEIFFADQTFTAIQKRTELLCKEIIKNDYDFKWLCFTRVDKVDHYLLKLMKMSGCHTIILGVESASPDLLSIYKKEYTVAQIKEVFNMCYKIGIQTVGTFLIGLPHETKESLYSTLRLAKEIKCDYFSFNVAVPRPGTKLRELAIKEGLFSGEEIVMDQAGTFITMPTKSLTKKQLSKIFNKILFNFYFNPFYLFRRLTKVKSLYDFYNSIGMGKEILKLLIGRK